ncbi:MAG: hypothetical protein B7X06_02275 [Verrucomicrobia bacterium 21-51-4]|nr:MAG: hypothetical protein B7X06_02275 [Verrucomicrobia bacterium 21-51-4]HQU08507.1 MarC family protein [Opitutales bacterium]
MEDQFLQSPFAFFLGNLSTFFALFNPLAAMPVFMTLTAPMTSEMAKKTALKASLTVFWGALIFSLIGLKLLQVLGLSIEGLRLAGGIIVFMIGYSMITGKAAAKPNGGADSDVHLTSDIAITPLGIPLVCGPGALTGVIMAMNDAGAAMTSSATAWDLWSRKLIVLADIGAIALITYIIFIFSRKLHRVLGEGGAGVLMRMMGLILMIIAAQFVIDGAVDTVNKRFGVPLAAPADITAGNIP